MITAKYFKESEFKKCVPSCSLQDMQQHTMDRLDKAREIAGIPFVLNCAYRSVAWDKSKGRDGESAHCKGEAVDIRCNTSANRMKIVKSLLKAGFPRVGVGKNYIHADDCETLPQDVMWHYYQ